MRIKAFIFIRFFLVSLIFTHPTLAQNFTDPYFTSGEDYGVRPRLPSVQGSVKIAPGLYTFVQNGQIIMRNPAGQLDLAPGQFGFTPSSNTPTMAVPNSGPQFQPPTPFSGSTAQLPGNDLRMTVDGGNLNAFALRENQDQARVAAINACASGTQARCDAALQALVVATRFLYPNAVPADFRNYLLTSFRQVVAGVQANGGATSTRAINIATIDAAFARAFPESTAVRPSSPA